DIDDQSDDKSHDDQVDDDNQDDEDDDHFGSDNNGDDFVHPKFSTHDEEAKDEEKVDEGPDAEEEDNELYGDLNINLEGRDVQMIDVHTTQVLEDTHVTVTPVNPDGQQQSSSVSSQFVSNMLNPSPDKDAYKDTVTLKRRRDDKDKDEEPSAGSDRGPREDEQEKNQSQSVLQRKRHPRPLASLLKGPKLNKRLQAKTLTPELLAGLTYELMKGSCKSIVELEFFLEEVYKATTNQLDWNNPEGHQYPHDLLKPLPLIPNSRGRRVIPFDHFITNDLEYLRGGASSRKYTTFVTKTKATDYGHIKESARDVYSKRRIIGVTELQSSNGITTSIWIGSLKADQSRCRRTLCFQRLFKNVHEKHRYPMTYERSSI
nr:hypothetical protein [Tanacetum cinerariifolium]